MKLGFAKKLWGHPVATQVARLKEIGVSERHIWIDGRGAETAQTFADACRPGYCVYHAADLRVFGNGRGEILGITDQLQAAGATVKDANSPKDSLSKQLDRALSELAKYNRWKGSKKSARRTGARGGRKKGENAEAERAKNMPTDAILRLRDRLGKKVTWRLIAYVTKISTATLRRVYRDME